MPSTLKLFAARLAPPTPRQLVTAHAAHRGASMAVRCGSLALTILAVQGAIAQAPGSSLGSPRTGPSSMSPNIPAAPLLASSAPPLVNPAGPAMRLPLPASTTPIQQPAATPVPVPAKPQGITPGVHRSAAATELSKSAPLVLLSPRRAQLLKQQQLLRAQENLLAQQARARPTAVATTGTPAKSAAELLKPGIRKINGRTSGAIATPGGMLTISGRGFGDVLGEATLVGQFPGGKVVLLPVQWADGEVVVRVPDGMRGVDDHLSTLTVATRVGQLFRQDQVRYVALREEISIAAGDLGRAVEILPDARWTPTVTGGDVGREQRGETLVCAKPGADVVRPRLKPGWELSGASMQTGRTDTGDGSARIGPGSRTFFPGYEFGPWSDTQIEVRWGVWRSHSSGLLQPDSDLCQSFYRLAIRAIGPAGLLPF